jgi:hypothetical protein
LLAARSPEKHAIEDDAADLKKAGALSRPTHLLVFVHPTVHQEIGCPFGECRPDPLSGTVPLRVVACADPKHLRNNVSGHPPPTVEAQMAGTAPGHDDRARIWRRTAIGACETAFSWWRCAWTRSNSGVDRQCSGQLRFCHIQHSGIGEAEP